jgi:hypothetical protein
MKAPIRSVSQDKKRKRIELPQDIKWSGGDAIQFDIVDEDTVTMKRIFKANIAEEEIPKE